LTAYLAVIFVTTTHLQLLKHSPITLPIINIGVNIKWFFTLVPWLYLVIHANMLLILALLTDKINLLEERIHPLDFKVRQDFIRRLHVLIFTQYLSRQHAGFLRLIIDFIIWTTIGFIPLVLLIWAQITFLPAQEQTIIWSQRVCILIDTILVIYFWNSILQKRRRSLLPKNWR
jgi:hypothetical protein